MILGKLKLKIATDVTGHRKAEGGGMAIFSKQKIADFPGLCVTSLITHINMGNMGNETLSTLKAV